MGNMTTALKINAAKDRLELALAGEVQRALLPQKCPLGCPHFRAAARSRTCGSIGGDLHDFIRINEDQIAVVIGDVVGHGVSAALVMAMILGFLRSERDSRPARIVSALNHIILALGQKIDAPLTCSLFYAVLDVRHSSALFVNAGHPRPYLCDRRSGTISLLGKHELLLGVQEYQAQERYLTFRCGERMVLYTDGIAEARDGAREPWGRRCLEEALRKHADQQPDEYADSIMAEVDEFRHNASREDDETIIVIDRV